MLGKKLLDADGLQQANKQNMTTNNWWILWVVPVRYALIPTAESRHCDQFVAGPTVNWPTAEAQKPVPPFISVALRSYSCLRKNYQVFVFPLQLFALYKSNVAKSIALPHLFHIMINNILNNVIGCIVWILHVSFCLPYLATNEIRKLLLTKPRRLQIETLTLNVLSIRFIQTNVIT